MPIHVPSNWTPFIACIQLKITQFIILRAFPCISQSAKPCYLNILSNLSSISPLIVIGMCEKSQKIFSRMSRNARHRKQANFFRQIDK